MKHFEASVFDQKGQQQQIEIDGDTLEEVTTTLHERGFTIHSLKEVQKKSWWQLLQSIEFGSKLSVEQRIRVVKTLGQMLMKGYEIDRVIDFLLVDERQKNVRVFLLQLQQAAKKGYKDYHELFLTVQEHFDSEFFSLLAAGQKTGTVGQNMVDYALGKAQMHEQKKTLMRTLSSKFILLGIVLMAFLVVVLFVVPQFQELFGESLALPWGMQVMVFISELGIQYGLWIFLVSLLFVAVVFGLYFSHEQLRFVLQHFILKMPVIGGLLRMLYTRNFLYLLGNLLQKGVTLMESMKILIEQTQQLCFQSVYRAVSKNLENGRKLEDVLRSELNQQEQQHFVQVPRGYLLESVSQAMMLGAKGGNLGEMLMEAYQSYDVQLQNRISASIRIIGMGLSFFTYAVMVFMIGSLALTLFRVMQDPTAFISSLFFYFPFYG